MMNAYICDAVRTPFGRYGGTLASVRADDLAAHTICALMERNPGINFSNIDDVILGCANQAGEDNRNIARMALLLAGLPVNVPGTTVNRLCGSSLDAIMIAARAIKSGEANLIIAGGVENMSRAPYVLGKSDKAFSRSMKIEDTTMGWRFINPKMRASYGVDSMPETAENVARQFSISREEQDLFALTSQKRVAEAYRKGIFNDEIIPVIVPQKNKGNIIFNKDEHPRDTTFEALSNLKGVVTPEGMITAGNASGINDGSGALLISSELGLSTHSLYPKARIVASAVEGVDPKIMGIGPVPAVRKVLKLAGLTLDQIDLIELNEAFAAQVLAVMKQLNIDVNDERVNPNGGAIALGHPLGASGARLVTTACYQLQRTMGRYALCTMCIGVGQGIAVIIERI
ncbi:3-oxoadipyl-CoA thiolase [Salmonella enterica subsp. enterica]|uniref:Beta-ketoadipyl-CoA thiolase n=1 Tax=Salmonella enterica TaxID=28901 RepID=A0A7D8ISP9_SALER|nr:3-oxoadipyl-CoA thiolase [Salmonella enterica subsp. enterica serovar Amherstiana]SUF95238.1 small (beta) subunit of the fatty acid-oxidizing multienzyme complex [Salmonella enterica]